ncbi:Imm32 family immunity protein [Micromonospora chersina]|uniref:Imm32 family immunity protein n=1 Tax=Micromonospora chersina TaxID=47854 RepID=UPI0036B4E163
MEDHRRCRLSVDDSELELAGPPAGLRALGQLLRHHAEPFEVAITGGVVSQEATAGALLVSLLGGTKLHFSGAREYLDIIWDALDGVTEQAETADDRTINRHQHIEYLQGDDYRSPDSVPLVIVADWPDAP